MPLLILLALVAVEIYLIIVVGGWIGALPTILLLVAGSLLGGYLLKREGARAVRAIRSAQAERRAPHREIADGILIFLGGVLMLLPGFLSDAVGLLCLFPPTRALLRKGLLGLAIRRFPPVLLLRDANRSTDRARRPDPRIIEGDVEPPLPPHTP